MTTHLLDAGDLEIRTVCGVPAFELRCADTVDSRVSVVDCAMCLGAENKAETPISQQNAPHPYPQETHGPTAEPDSDG